MVAEMVDVESQLVLSSWRMLEHPESLHTDHSDPFCGDWLPVMFVAIGSALISLRR